MAVVSKAQRAPAQRHAICYRCTNHVHKVAKLFDLCVREQDVASAVQSPMRAAAAVRAHTAQCTSSCE